MSSINTDISTDYRVRINRVFNYIDENPEQDLSLDKLASIACFSPFHFHRIFKFITGETVKEYVMRSRLEKIALKLLHNNEALRELAAKYGFGEMSSLSRSFRKYYGISPTEFRKQNPHRVSKIRQLDSKNGQVYPDHEKYLRIMDNLKDWIKMNAKIEIAVLDEMHTVSVMCTGPQNLKGAFDTLIKWASPQGLMNDKTRLATIYHDSFKVTEASKVRMRAAILLDSPVKAHGETEPVIIPGGKYIKAHFEIMMHDFEKSWSGLFLWMNENGYKKDDRNPFEIYYNNPAEHPGQLAYVDFFIPVK